MVNKFFTAVCCFSVCFVNPLLAQEKFTIAAAELSGLFNLNFAEDHSQADGIYYQLLQKILRETSQDSHYQIAIMPMRRAKQMFKQQQVACYVPGLDTFDDHEQAELPDDLKSSVPINRALVRVLSGKTNRLISKPDDINKADSISAVRGVPLSADMNQMMARAGSRYLVTSELENLKLLSSGRVDFAMAFYPDVIFAYKSLGLETPYAFDPAYSPLEIIDNVLCHPQHQLLIQLIDSKLSQYSEDGSLRQLLGDYYLGEIKPELQP